MKIINISPPNTKVFFTADTHFNSERTLELGRRPFRSVTEMNEAIIHTWNRTVKQKDIVFHLGDFGAASYIRELNGHVFLLYGNYEREDDSSVLKYRDYFEYGGGILNEEDGVLVKISDEILHLCHEPSKMVTKYFNLFGHVHQLSMVKKHAAPNGKFQCGLNVGWDVFHKPIDMLTVNFYKNAVLNHYDQEVFW